MAAAPAPSSSSTVRARDSETGRRRRQAWSQQEDQVLIEALRAAKEAAGVRSDDTASADPDTISHISWAMVASRLPGRTAKDCRKRLVYSLDVNLRKGAWTEEEDQQLLEAMSAYANLRNGDMAKIKWSAIARAIGTRSGDQASKRWREVLNPALNRAEWSQEEDQRLMDLIDTHRSDHSSSGGAGNGLKDWTFSTPSTSSSSSSSSPDPNSGVRLDCSWNEIAKQHGTRTALQVRNRFMLIRQLKHGAGSNGGAGAGIPSSISRLGPVRQNMYRAKLASFSSTTSSSTSSGASDDGSQTSPHLRKSISATFRSRASSSATRSVWDYEHQLGRTYDARGGIDPSVASSSAAPASYESLSGSRPSWQQSPSLFSNSSSVPTAAESEGSYSPAQWTTMAPSTTIASWSPASMAAPVSVNPDQLAQSAGAFTLPPSFFGPSATSHTSSHHSTSAPASLDAVHSSWPTSTLASTTAPLMAGSSDGVSSEMDFYQSLLGGVAPPQPPPPPPPPHGHNVGGSVSPWSHEIANPSFSQQQQQQQQQHHHRPAGLVSRGPTNDPYDAIRRSSVASSTESSEYGNAAGDEAAQAQGGTGPGKHLNIFGGAFVL